MACHFTYDTKSTDTANATAFYTFRPYEDQRAQLATLSPYFPNWWRDEDGGNALVPA